MKIRANGIEIEYDISGPDNGIPLILISGFGSQMVSWPDELYRMFTDAGIKLIRFDNRDVGLAQKWDGIIPKTDDVLKAVAEGRKPDIPYTLDDMAADAAGLQDALGIDSAHIAGASMGGMIAQLVALNHPEKTRSLISIFSTTGDHSLPRSTPEAQAALQGRPPNGERATVIAHSLKGRRAMLPRVGRSTRRALASLSAKAMIALIIQKVRHASSRQSWPRHRAPND